MDKSNGATKTGSRKRKAQREQLPGGWYPRRRGILEHLEDGTISLLDSAVHDFLCLTCDHKTGLAWSSSKKIQLLAPADLDERAVRRSIRKLERLGWIKRWNTKGKRGNYPVLIARFYVQRGFDAALSAPSSVRDVSVKNAANLSATSSVKWWKVNAERTTDWQDIQYDPVHEDVREDDRDENGVPVLTVSSPVREVSGIQDSKTSQESQDIRGEGSLRSPAPGALELERQKQIASLIPERHARWIAERRYNPSYQVNLRTEYDWFREECNQFGMTLPEINAHWNLCISTFDKPKPEPLAKPNGSPPPAFPKFETITPMKRAKLFWQHADACGWTPASDRYDRKLVEKLLRDSFGSKNVQSFDESTYRAAWERIGVGPKVH